MRKVIGTLAVLIAGTMGAGVASAQEAGVDQYAPPTTTSPTTTTPSNPGTGTPAPAIEGSAVAGVSAQNNGAAGSGTAAQVGGGTSGTASGAGTPSPTGTGSSAPPTSSSTGSASSSAGAGTSSQGPIRGASTVLSTNRVAFLQFGAAPRDLENDITTALERAGLQILFLGDSTRKQLKAFLASPQAAAMSSDDPKALGKAFGAQLVNPTRTLLPAFPVLFGPETPYVPVIRAVLTRRDGLSAEAVAFQLGVAEGLRAAGVPVAYVERSDRKTSHVSDYKQLDVPVVDDVDNDAGKLRLGQIMLRVGQFANTTEVGADRAVAQVDAAGVADGRAGSGTAPLILLVGLIGGAALWGGNAYRGARRTRVRAH